MQQLHNHGTWLYHRHPHAMPAPPLTAPCPCQVEVYADKSGSFMRLLGLELSADSPSAGPKCQRFAGIVEDGILVKLVRRAGLALCCVLVVCSCVPCKGF
jgi:hypothetical protein